MWNIEKVNEVEREYSLFTADYENPENYHEFKACYCDLCGGLPGSRYLICGYHEHKLESDARRDFWACPDCVAYIANGDIPAD